MPIPNYQTLMLPVLKIAARGETRVPKASAEIADLLGLTEEGREEMLPRLASVESDEATI